MFLRYDFDINFLMPLFCSHSFVLKVKNQILSKQKIENRRVLSPSLEKEISASEAVISQGSNIFIECPNNFIKIPIKDRVEKVNELTQNEREMHV